MSRGLDLEIFQVGIVVGTTRLHPICGKMLMIFYNNHTCANAFKTKNIATFQF
jgi:hypothetical protein